MINQAAQEITGYHAKEVVGRYYSKKFVARERDCRSMLLDTLETGVSHISVELDYPTRSGYRRISLSSSRLQGGSSENIGTVVVMRDLTEKQQLQQNVMQSSLLAATNLP